MSSTENMISTIGKLFEASKDLSTEKLVVLGLVVIGTIAVLNGQATGNAGKSN